MHQRGIRTLDRAQLRGALSQLRQAELQKDIDRAAWWRHKLGWATTVGAGLTAGSGVYDWWSRPQVSQKQRDPQLVPKSQPQPAPQEQLTLAQKVEKLKKKIAETTESVLRIASSYTATRDLKQRREDLQDLLKQARTIEGDHTFDTERAQSALSTTASFVEGDLVYYMSGRSMVPMAKAHREHAESFELARQKSAKAARLAKAKASCPIDTGDVASLVADNKNYMTDVYSKIAEKKANNGTIYRGQHQTPLVWRRISNKIYVARQIPEYDHVPRGNETDDAFITRAQTQTERQYSADRQKRRKMYHTRQQAAKEKAKKAHQAKLDELLLSKGSLFQGDSLNEKQKRAILAKIYLPNSYSFSNNREGYIPGYGQSHTMYRQYEENGPIYCVINPDYGFGCDPYLSKELFLNVAKGDLGIKEALKQRRRR